MNKPIYPYNLERIEEAYEAFDRERHNYLNYVQTNLVDCILYQNIKYLLDKVQQLEDRLTLADEKIRKMANRIKHLPHEVE